MSLAEEAFTGDKNMNFAAAGPALTEMSQFV
ncbi:MAG: hypothetical protein ACJAXQ_001528 [Parvibaculaceae bacterium]